MSALTIAPSTIFADVTVLSPGVGIVTAEPICIINTESPLARLAPNIIVLVSTIAKPSAGAEVPVLGFCITPLTETRSCAALVTLAAAPELLLSRKSYVAILPSKVGAPVPPAGHKNKNLKSPVDVTSPQDEPS